MKLVPSLGDFYFIHLQRQIMQEGYIKLWRRLQHNKLWLLETFTKGQAWVDLLILANHRPNSILCRGIEITVNRGQVGWSEVALASRWKWSRNKVRRFMNDLQTAQQIEQQKNNVTSLITIVNYHIYQQHEQVNETANDTAERQQKDTNKNEKNEKKESISPELPLGFAAFWKSYPKKVGKQATIREWKKQQINGEWQIIVDKVEEFKGSKKWIDGFILDPERFIKNRRWEDEMEMPLLWGGGKIN